MPCRRVGGGRGSARYREANAPRGSLEKGRLPSAISTTHLKKAYQPPKARTGRERCGKNGSAPSPWIGSRWRVLLSSFDPSIQNGYNKRFTEFKLQNCNEKEDRIHFEFMLSRLLFMTLHRL